MTRKPEILFVDPKVADVPAILLGLRPEVEAILLDSRRPAAKQIAAALAHFSPPPRGEGSGVRGLDAIHVIAHGAPGRVSFAGGEWSTETLERDADDLAGIGRALRDGGELRLWSCETGRGVEGERFVLALAEAAAADVAALTARVGASALGGTWELSGPAARPPLTAAGVAGYAGVFPTTVTSWGDGERLKFFGRWPAGAKAGTYFIVWNNSGRLEVLGKFNVPVGMAGTFAISAPLPAGTYSVGPLEPGTGTIAVYSGQWNEIGQAAATWSVGDFDPAITTTLNHARNITPNNRASAGAIR